MDGLLVKLSGSGVGCYIGVVHLLVCFVMRMFCASALITMLDICTSCVVSHGLEFNINKMQLICFHTPSIRQCTGNTFFTCNLSGSYFIKQPIRQRRHHPSCQGHELQGEHCFVHIWFC